MTPASNQSPNSPNSAANRPMFVLLIDDHALFCQGVAHALTDNPNFIVEHCASIAEALPLLSQYSFDLVLLDNDLGQERGLDFIPAARKIGYSGKVLVVTGWISNTDARRLLRQGVSGIFMKHHGVNKLTMAIRTVGVGERWVDSSFLELSKDASASPAAPPPKFTDLQRMVLRLVVQGLSNKEIGDKMQISESYVKALIQGLFKKTGVRNRGQLVRIGIEQYRDEIVV
jgi:two-component system nitrate/nitrite response regulator NarL